MKRLVPVLALLLATGCQLSAIPQLFAPPKGSGRAAAAASAAPGMPSPTAGTSASTSPATGGTASLTVDGAPVTLVGTFAGSGGSYEQRATGAQGADEWTFRFSLTPTSALGTDPIDAEALTISGAFVVGTPGAAGGNIRQYVFHQATKLIERENQSLSVNRRVGKLDVVYSVPLTGIPSDGGAKKRFVLTASGLNP